MENNNQNDRLVGKKTGLWLSSILILLVLVVLLAGIGALLGGLSGLIAALLASAVAFFTVPQVSPDQVMRLFKGVAIPRLQAPSLYAVVDFLSERGGLVKAPKLYLLPIEQNNALTIGDGQNSALGISPALLHNLTQRELAGVLGHEIAHIVNKDARYHLLSSFVTQATSMFALLGQILLLLYIPLALFGGWAPPFWVILFLLLAPFLGLGLQMALSRTREYAADLAAIELTKDPEGLARALEKIEWQERPILQWFFGLKKETSSFWHSHPPLQERVRRLREFSSRADYSRVGSSIGRFSEDRPESPADLLRPWR